MWGIFTLTLCLATACHMGLLIPASYIAVAIIESLVYAGEVGGRIQWRSLLQIKPSPRLDPPPSARKCHLPTPPLCNLYCLVECLNAVTASTKRSLMKSTPANNITVIVKIPPPGFSCASSGAIMQVRVFQLLINTMALICLL